MNGIVTGMILALIASGLTLIFGIMDVVNFAHGELFMLGAYMGVVVLASTGSFWLALINRQAHHRALLGAAMQVATLRSLIGRDPLTTILATFGISLILQNYALWQFGPVARKIREPFTGQLHTLLSGISLVPADDRGPVGGHHRRPSGLFLKDGNYGIWIRATTQDRVMAQAMGIPVPWVYTAVFAIGAAHGGGERRAVRAAGRRQPHHGARLGAQGLHRRGGRRHGQSRRLDRGRDLHQPAGSLRVDLGEPSAGRHRLVRRADPHLLFRPTGLFVPTPK